METKQIISWLRDKADRAQNLSWTRMMHMAADRLWILENRQRWIPVTERLPENGTNILSYMSDEFESRIFPANYDCGIWFDCVLNVSQSMVTHWMPLPEPPKN